MDENLDIVFLFSRLILGFRESGGRTIPIWRSDPKLQQNMQRLVELDRDATEEFWARYFLRVLREELEAESCGGQDYAKGHLFAYLQRLCYFVALKLNRKHSGVDFLRQLYTYQDYFQIANSFASDPAKLLKNFKFDLPYTVQAYAKPPLEGLIKQIIGKENKQINRLKYSHWGLLKNTKKGELEAALRGRVKQDQVEQYLLVWQCFMEIYASTTSHGSRSLAPPTDEEFQQMTRRYNQRRLGLYEPGEAVDECRVRQMLEVCTSAVRDWRTVSFSYPDANRDVFDPSSGDCWETIIPDIPDYTSNELLARLEQEDAWNQINELLSQAFAQLSAYDQSLLRLWEPGLGLTQTEIALVLNLQQYQISRQLMRCKRSLLKAFAKACNESFNLHLSNNIIAQLDAPIEEWLEKHCKNFLTSILEAILPSINSEERRLLQLSYCQNFSYEEIQQELGIPVLNVSHKVANIKQFVLTTFTINLGAALEIYPNSLAPVDHKMDAFVEHWLHTIACPLH